MLQNKDTNERIVTNLLNTNITKTRILITKERNTNSYEKIPPNYLLNNPITNIRNTDSYKNIP